MFNLSCEKDIYNKKSSLSARPPIVISYIIQDILSYQYGFVNVMLRKIGLGGRALDWMADPQVALYTLIGITVWSGTGFSMSVYASSLTSFPNELIEAAEMDGAGKFQLIILWGIRLMYHSFSSHSMLQKTYCIG